MEILSATLQDLEKILHLQYSAYQTEAERYNDYTIHPLTQTLDGIREEFKTRIFLKAVSEGEVIGTVRALEDAGTCYIGRLAVRTDRRNRGIGTALMKRIETCFRPKRFELFVGSKSDDNIRLYEKLGYTIFKTARYGSGDIEIFYMEKTVEIKPEPSVGGSPAQAIHRIAGDRAKHSCLRKEGVFPGIFISI